jgi:hypothetical protein
LLGDLVNRIAVQQSLQYPLESINRINTSFTIGSGKPAALQ